ncbi:bacteriorhodopsin [Hymenobacter sp. IS2118]|uniref:bacteriorhodopsin n=1 Tax=Hymenobacter sp. IS2118 TaxID=1505605 RepID=UPI0009DDC264|nr:bacteriorhodopsin [Hymenobacter sp. IS2118]
MQNSFLGVVTVPVDDPVAFTFFIGYMAMAAAAVFFLFERSTVADKWKTSLLISGLITGIAAVHYYYMRDYYIMSNSTPIALRYIDWTLTVPLMVVEFYLLVRAAGAKASLLWKLVLAALVMLVFGYIGEAFTDGSMGHSALWGTLSTLGREDNKKSAICLLLIYFSACAVTKFLMLPGPWLPRTSPARPPMAGRRPSITGCFSTLWCG